jgi:pimeloyl-ACP methyl ester carboxylesterase
MVNHPDTLCGTAPDDATILNNYPGRYPIGDWTARYWTVTERGDLTQRQVTVQLLRGFRHWIRLVEIEGKKFKVECYGVDYRTQASTWPPRDIFIFWHGLGQKGFATPNRLNTARPHLFREIYCQFSQVYPEQVFVSVGVEPLHPMGKKRPFFEDEAQAVAQALDLDAGGETLSGEAPAVRIAGYSTGGVMAGTLGYLLGAREIFLFGGAGLCDLSYGVPELVWRTHWSVYQIGLEVMAGPEGLGLLRRVASLKAWQRLHQRNALQALWGLLNRVNPLHPDPRIAFSRLRSTWQDLAACTAFNPFFERLEAPVYVLWPTDDWLFPLACLRRPLPHNIHIATCDGHHYVPGAEPELIVHKILQWVKSNG